MWPARSLGVAAVRRRLHKSSSQHVRRRERGESGKMPRVEGGVLPLARGQVGLAVLAEEVSIARLRRGGRLPRLPEGLHGLPRGDLTHHRCSRARVIRL